MTFAERLYDKLSTIPTQTLIDTVLLIGGGDVDQDKETARLYMIVEYEIREGGEAAGKLCRQIGRYCLANGESVR